jgi:hypothetical protein
MLAFLVNHNSFELREVMLKMLLHKLFLLNSVIINLSVPDVLFR